MLADLRTVLFHTARIGGASNLDFLFLVPSIHRQRYAGEVNAGEYPATAALTTGYVFRVENEAMVYYLQSVGRTGHLTNLHVTPPVKRIFPLNSIPTEALPRTAYILGILLTLAVIPTLVLIQDYWALVTLSMWILARLMSVLVTQSRTVMGWKGVPEPGVEGDLLTLLSQDRWVRMQGLVDDLKAVTSGHWMRDETAFESFILSVATFLIYASIAVSSLVSMEGNLLLAGLLVLSTGLLGLCNAWTSEFRIYDRVVRMVGEPKPYARRRQMADELIAETKRHDWAVGLGLIPVPSGESGTSATM